MILKIGLKDTLISGRADLLVATDAQLENARLSAMRKTMRRKEGNVRRMASKKLNVPQKSIKDRFFKNRLRRGDQQFRLWIGTLNLSPYSVGKVSRYGVPGKTGGVKVGRRSYRGAFLGNIYSDKQSIWIRRYSQLYDSSKYPSRYRRGDRFDDQSMRGRFPVVEASIEIDADVRQAVDSETSDLGAEFERIYLQELNYQVNVKGQRRK